MTVSYTDPRYQELADKYGKKYGLPDGWLGAILTKGERSNADQVSEDGARTVFQVIPSTRDLVLKKYGVDAYLSEENAAEAAALVGRDAFRWASQRTQDPTETRRLAAGYYHAGGDTGNWGRRTQAYMDRVEPVGTYAKAVEQSAPKSGLALRFKTYKDGSMPADEKAAFERDVAEGKIVLPRGMKVASAPEKAAAPTVPTGALAAWQQGKMSPDDAAEFEALVKDGTFTLPAGQTLEKLKAATQIPGTQAPTAQPERSIGDRIIGAGEAALTLGSAALTGLPGAAVGFVAGTGEALADGTFGTQAGAKAIEDRASQAASAYVYKPRSAAGMENVQDISQALAPLQALGPMAAELSAVSTMAKPANVIAGANMAARDVLDTARSAVPAGLRKAPPAVPAAAPAVVEMPAQQIAQTARTAADSGLGRARAEKILAEQAAPNPETVKAAERLGIADYLQPDHVTTSEAFRQVTAAIKSNPTSKIALAEREGLRLVGERATKLIEEIGGRTDPSETSAVTRSRMQAIQSELDVRGDALYDQLRAAIPAQEAAPAPTVLAFINKRAQDLGGVENLSSMEKQILGKLQPRSGKTPTYALLDDVRRDLTASRVKRQGAFKDADSGLVKKLEAELMADQKATVQRFGMLDVFDEARKTVAIRKGLEDDMVALFGRDLDGSIAWRGKSGIGGAIAAAGKGDVSRIGRLVAAVPADMRQEVVATGIGTVIKNAAKAGELDFTGYVRWYDGLKRNRQAYTAVMSNLPLESRKQLEALYRVSQGVSNTLAAKSTTGRLNTIRAELMGTDGLMESLYTYAQRTAAGAGAEVVSTSVGLPGAGLSAALTSALMKGKPRSFQAVDDLLASPEFQALARAKSEPQRKTAVIKLARSKAFSKFAASVGNPPELRGREAWIAAAMQQSQQPQPTKRDQLVLH